MHLTIILTLRRQDEFLQSAYNQAINQRLFEKAKTFLITDYLPKLDWFSYIKEVKNVFPEAELSIIPYDKNILDKTPIMALVGMVLGSEFLQSKEAILIYNKGVSKEGAKLFERVWKKYEKDIKYPDMFRSILQRSANKGRLKEYHYWTYKEKIDFLKHYNENNRKLADTYWKKDFNMTNFSNPTSDNESKEVSDIVEVDVIYELFSIIQKQKERDNSSILIRLARRINHLTGL